jgi:hypothetical protein
METGYQDTILGLLRKRGEMLASMADLREQIAVLPGKFRKRIYGLSLASRTLLPPPGGHAARRVGLPRHPQFLATAL